jgi:hypothetical protein
MKSDPEHPPKLIFRQPHYQKIPTKHQKIFNKIPKNTNNHKKSTTKTKNYKLLDQRTQRNRKKKKKKKTSEKHPLGFTGVGP